MARPANPNLRQTLIDAARAEFAEHGLAAARIEDVTKRAGVSKGSFYLHFESKEQVYELIAQEFLEEIDARLQRFRDQRCTELSAALVREMVAADVAFSDFLWQSRDALRMVLEGAAGTPFAWLSDELVRRFSLHMQSALVDADFHEKGIASSLDRDLLSDILTGAIVMFSRRILRSDVRPDFRHWSIQLHRVLAGGMFRPEIARSLIEILDAIAAEGGVPEKGETP